MRPRIHEHTIPEINHHCRIVKAMNVIHTDKPAIIIYTTICDVDRLENDNYLDEVGSRLRRDDRVRLRTNSSHCFKSPQHVHHLFLFQQPNQTKTKQFYPHQLQTPNSKPHGNVSERKRTLEVRGRGVPGSSNSLFSSSSSSEPLPLPPPPCDYRKQA